MIIGHVFHECHLGAGHAGLLEMLRDKVKKPLASNEFALFCNRSLTACKILSPDSHVILYYRGNRSMTSALIKSLPTVFSGKSLTFTGSLESKLLKLLEVHTPRGGGPMSKVRLLA